MYYLTINPGSSSLKYALFTSDETRLMFGKVARMFETGVVHIVYDDNGGVVSEEITTSDLGEWINIMHKDVLNYLPENSELCPIIRIVHDGGNFIEPVVMVDQDTLQIMRDAAVLAPLHMPLALRVISEIQRIFRQNIWVTPDTYFHKTISWDAQRTGLPLKVEKELGLRRFGFHGLSHEYISQEIEKRDGSDHAIISCHLGGGSSICAIQNGRSLDISMGLGPGTGLMMSSRAGDVDWEAIVLLIEKKQLDPNQIREMLYKEAGIKGIAKETDMMPELLKHLDEPLYQKACDHYIYSAVKVIGSYIPLFKIQPTHLVFTGGIGGGSFLIRKMITERFGNLGWQINESKNKSAGDADSYHEIHHDESSIKIITIPTDEELMMARLAILHIN